MRTVQDLDVAGIAAGLGDDQIHVWQLRYERAQRRNPLCALLAMYLDIPAHAVTLIDGEHGRPEFAEPSHRALQFNWSHSGNTALIAVARGVAPGIDLERIRPRAHAMQLAQRFFHPEEVAALTALPVSEQEQAFLQLWTGKEAVLKATGRGIAFGLDRLRLAVAPAPARLVWLDGDDSGQWQLHALSIGAGHVASLAWRGPDRIIAQWTLADSA